MLKQHIIKHLVETNYKIWVKAIVSHTATTY